jgi:hypothetical protein
VPATPESDEDSDIGHADPTSWRDQSARIRRIVDHLTGNPVVSIVVLRG